MENKLIVGFFIGIMILGLVSSLGEINLEKVNCQMLKPYESQVIGYKIPKQVPYGDETFNIYIEKEIFGSLVLKNWSVFGFSCSENFNRTYDIYIKDNSVFEKFENSKDILETINNELNNGDIEIKGVGFGKKLKFFFSKLGLRIWGWFN